MKRIVVLAVLMMGLTAFGQTPNRIWTSTSIPSKEVLDRLNMNLAWRTTLPVESRRNGIANIQHLGDDIIVQLRDGLLLCLDPESGAVRWSKHVGGHYPVARKVGYGPGLVFVLDGNRILALHRKDGTLHWELDLPEVPIAPPMAGELFLYVPFANGRVQTYALPETFTKAQKMDTDERNKIRQRFVDFKTKFRASDAKTTTGGDPRSTGGDALRGRSAAPANLELRGTTTMDNAVASRGEARRLLQKGAEATNRPVLVLSNSPGFRASFPANVNSVGVLITGTEREAMLLRRDPENPVYRFSTAAPMSLPPVEFGNNAYLTCADATVYSVDLAAGLINWRFSAGSDIIIQPIVTEDSVFIQTANHGLIRVNRKTGASEWQQSEATQFQAVNDKFVYGTDRFGKLLVLDRQSGAVLSQYDLSAFNAMFANRQTDRLILAANDGSVLSLRDKSHVQPMHHQPKSKVAVPVEKKTDDNPK